MFESSFATVVFFLFFSLHRHTMIILHQLLVGVLLVFTLSYTMADDSNWVPDIVNSEFPSIGNVLQFEDSPKLILRTTDEVFISENYGKDWNKQDFKDNDGNDLKILHIQEFEFFPKAAVVFTFGSSHFITLDGAESWKKIDVDLHTDKLIGASAQINFENPDYMLFEFKYLSDDSLFKQRVFYTKDGLKSPVSDINVENTGDCSFTHINPDFTEGDLSTIVCITREFNAFHILKADKIISTTDFFDTINVSGNDGLDNSHVLKIKIVNSFVVLLVSTDRYSEHSTVLYTSKDGARFYKANFEDQNKSLMFNILDSNKNTLYISAYGKNPKDISNSADIYRSDSDGRNFRKIFGDVFSNMLGMSLISKVKILDGVWIASHNEKYKGMQLPDSKSKITFDDGETWNYLNVTDNSDCYNDDSCSLHIAWLTQRAGDGDLNTGETPGILLGIGNTGEYLSHSIDKLNTYVSRNGGQTWAKVCDKPTVFAYGDLGNILITMPVDLDYFMTGSTKNTVDYFNYSLDQGETWTEMKLSSKVMPFFFVNNKDNTDKTFALVGQDVDSHAAVLKTIDFNGAFDQTCSDDDMEEWLARVDPITMEQICVYGHSEKFSRRKVDAKCFVNKNYDDLIVMEKPCTCTIEDSECNSGFEEDSEGNCKPNLSFLSQYCETGKKNVKLSSRRIVPGNLCENGYSPPKDDFNLKCKDALEDKKKNEINVNLSEFKENIVYYQYLNKNTTSMEFQNDVLIVLTASRKVYISFDGEVFNIIAAEKSFIYIYTNPYWPDSIYLITDEGEILSSLNRGLLFTSSYSPYTSGLYKSFGMTFNAKDPQTYILYSNDKCDSMNNCEMHVSITENNGKSFTDLLEDSSQCVFADSVFNSTLYAVNQNEIICSQKVKGQSYYRLISSSDSLTANETVLFDKIIGFTTSENYMIVAKLNEDHSLNAFVSVNGNTFAEVKFPHDVDLHKQTAYTILDVTSNELFMHLTTYDEWDHQFGALLKANYNGTLFTTAINYVNRNNDAYVDFESAQSLEGLAILNVVMNPAAVRNGEGKKLVSKISHNDAATWSLLPAPANDSNGKKIGCKGCSLHLHSYTERLDPSRDSFSSSAALGMMFGLGNVGTSLSPLDGDDIALYFTKDAGFTWKEIAKGRYIWEFGDQGTVLVIVKTMEETNILKYSLDLGETWNDYIFSPEKSYLVEDIATVPSDTSLKFILIVKDVDVSHSIFTIDFSNVYSRQCVLPLDASNLIGDDYEYFVPKHPSSKSSCIFGHETKYLRRKSNRSCFVGLAPLHLGSKVVNNCECTRDDYECDYNYELSIDGTCKLVKGLESLKGDEVCKNDDVNEWWEPTGYRKLTLTTCTGGLGLDKWNSHPCPGKIIEKGKISGMSMFWIIFIPFVVFATALIFVYEKGVRRNGGFSRLGEIRLDEDDNLQLIEENQTDKVVNQIIKFGVFSFHMIFKFWRGALNIFRRVRGNETHTNSGNIGAFFNDMVDDDQSLFGDLNDDEDAREINSFLDYEHDEDFDNFVTHDDDEIGHNNDTIVDNTDVRLSDNEDEEDEL